MTPEAETGDQPGADQIDDPQTEIETLADDLREYVDIRRELFELKLLDKVFGASATALAWGMIVFIGAMTLLMLSIGGAIWISSAMGNSFAGFFIIAGFYALLGLVLYAGRKKLIQQPFADRLIDRVVNEDEYKEEADPTKEDQNHGHHGSTHHKPERTPSSHLKASA